MFKSTCGCVPVNLEFRVASEDLILTPPLFRCDDVRLLLGLLVCGLWTFLTNTVDCAYILAAMGIHQIFPCFAFFQFKLFGELVFAMFDSGVFGLRPLEASKGENFYTARSYSQCFSNAKLNGDV